MSKNWPLEETIKRYIYIYTHHSPCSIESPLLNSRNRQSLLLEKKITRLIHAATRRLQRPLPHDNRRGVISRWRKGSLLLLRRRKPASRLVGSALLGSTLTFQFPRFISSVRAWCTGCTLGKERSLVIFLPSFFICVYIYICETKYSSNKRDEWSSWPFRVEKVTLNCLNSHDSRGFRLAGRRRRSRADRDSVNGGNFSRNASLRLRDG